jgi:lysophospholipase L1-like esterase
MTRVLKTSISQWIPLTLALIATLVILAFGLFQTTMFAPSEVLIIGDSITELPAIGGNQGNKGWWQYLLDGKKGSFMLSAESGSGYIAKGTRGTSFYDRLPYISHAKPKAIIIAGGVNDRNVTNPDNSIKKYYDALARILTANHISPDNVYVFVPRPANTASNVTAIIKSNATRVGVNFIATQAYTNTYDNLHPDSVGAKVLEQSFAKNSNFDERLK